MRTFVYMGVGSKNKVKESRRRGESERKRHNQTEEIERKKTFWD